MTKDKNNKKLIQDVQDTGDEAARLLADLEADSNSKTTFQPESCINGKQNTINQQPIHNSYRSIQASQDIKDQEPRSSNPAVGIGLIAFLVFIVVVASISQPSAEVASTSAELKSSDSSSGSVQKQKATMTSSQQTFYDKTLFNAYQAVLKMEHKAAITDLKMLKRGQYKDLLGIDIGLVNDKIIQAQKQINFLDQPGDSKYWETTTYGSQWFDEHADNHFKVFFAYSRKCKNPLITFAYFPSNSQKVVKTYIKRPITYISTIYVPYYGENELGIENFQCN